MHILKMKKKKINSGKSTERSLKEVSKEYADDTLKLLSNNKINELQRNYDPSTKENS